MSSESDVGMEEDIDNDMDNGMEDIDIDASSDVVRQTLR